MPSRGQRGERHSVTGPRDRLRGVHVQVPELGCGDHRERVHLWAEAAEGLHELGAGLLAPDEGRLDDDERAAAQVLGEIRDRRELHEPRCRRELGRRALRPDAPRVEDLGCALEGEEERAGVHLGDGVEGELDRRDDAEAPAAAANGPEEVRLVVGVRAHVASIGRDELDGEHAVRREAVPAAEPADAASERVADDAHVAGGARQPGEPVLGGRERDLRPEDACLDARAAPHGIDLDAAHARGPDEDRVLQRVESRGEVAGSLRGQPQAGVAGVIDDANHVLGGLGEDDGCRVLVGCEVPGLPSGVPVLAAGQDDLAVDERAELLERCGISFGCDGDGHGFLRGIGACRRMPPLSLPRLGAGSRVPGIRRCG
jgi:hypothetical protein